jgi:site-specific DNA-methyltransferase (adenine-specific)
MTNSLCIHNELYNIQEISKEQMEKWKSACFQTFPTEKYQIIYADPPWQYEQRSSKMFNQCDAHYPTMSLTELKEIPISSIADNHCALYLWTSNPMLPKAIALIEHWGFEYKTVFKVWRKVNNDGTNVMVPGWWSRSSTELLLVATKGTPLKHFKIANHTEIQEFTSIRGIHSEKPDEIRECIENFMQTHRKIELFARKTVENWDAWGLEVPGFFYSLSADITYSENKRSIGIQVSSCNNLSTNTKRKNANLSIKIKSNNGIPLGHKDNCKCFVCKRIASKIQDSTILSNT